MASEPLIHERDDVQHGLRRTMNLQAVDPPRPRDSVRPRARMEHGDAGQPVQGSPCWPADQQVRKLTRWRVPHEVQCH